MTDSTLDVTQPFDRPQKLLKITDNGDGTYSISVSASSLPLPSGGATAANQALELTELRAMNLLSSVVFDTILITYTDTDKDTISKVEWKLAGVVVKTLTPTFGATTDAWVKS
jgi:hypothetical protein